MEWREEDVVIEEVGGRNLPWAVDIFLYPTNVSGLLHIVVFLVLFC